MLKNYIKIALKVLLRRKFFTFVSLFGISFTLLVLMVIIAFADHIFSPVKSGSVLDRTLVIGRIEIQGERMHVSSFPSYYFLDKYVRTMKQPETISFHSRPSVTAIYTHNKKLELQLKFTDANFWDIVEFDFAEGGPFTESMVTNVDNVAVITERVRKQIFGNDSVIGKYLETTTGNYRVVGVIPNRDVRLETSHSDIYVPATTSESALQNTRLFSNYMCYLSAENKSDFNAIRTEFENRKEQVLKDYEDKYDLLICDLKTQKEIQTQQIMGFDSETSSIVVFSGVIALMILFMSFPAINLININISRIIERSSEIGIRKAFGASSKTLVGQFMVENVILTLIGGLIAFLLSIIVLKIIGDSGIIPYGQFGMNIRVFSYCLLVSLFFGLFSGVLPAYKMSKLHPVDALKGVE
jgi:putative ABC transport system permease protein